MTTASEGNPPQYNNMPVILVHLIVDSDDDTYTKYYWCAPYEYAEPVEGDHPNVPRVFCPSCSTAHMR